MGFATGMKQIKAMTAPSEQKEFAKRLKIADGKTLTLRVINEMDEDSENYDKERGLAGVVEEHKSPHQKLWMRKFACTKNTEGKCWACEQWELTQDKRWRSKMRFYFSALVTDPTTKESEVVYWDTSVFKSPVYDALMDQYLDTKSVSNLEWRLRRSGSGMNDTTYTLAVKSFDTKPFDWTGIEPVDLNDLVPDVPYAEQEAYLGGPIGAEESEDEDDVPAEATGENIQW